MTSWLRLLVRALPREFRAAYGEDLLLAIDDWRSDPDRPKLPPVAISATWFLLRTNLLERLNPTVNARTLPQPGKQATTMDLLLQDLRYAARSLLKRPTFTLIALLTLAVGVGANTAIFSVVNAVILKPLPYAEAGSLVQLRRTHTNHPGDLMSMSQVDLEDIARDVPALRAVAGYQNTTVTLTGNDEPEVLDGQAVTQGVLRVFGVSPAQGRDLVEADNIPNGPRVTVITDALLRSHLNGDPNAVGKTLFLDGEHYEIVGVAPPGFTFRDASLWIPLYNDTEGCGRGCQLLTGVAAITPGSGPDDVAAQLDVVAARLQAEFPETNTNTSYAATDLKESLLGSAQQGLLILLGAVGLVLVIAAANLASLQVARGTSRQNELAVRSALGASRSRISGLILLETVLLAIGGGALGVALGTAATKLVVALAPSDVPRLDQANLDLRVLTFALVTSLAVSLLFALWPTWRMSRAASSVRRSTDDRGDVRVRNLLMVGEVALSLVLLVGAGLLLRTYDKLLNVDVGFDASNLYGTFIALPEQPYDQPEEIIAYFEQVEEKLSTVPGIESVGSILGRPFGMGSLSTTVHFQGEPPAPPEEDRSAAVRIVTPGYIETMRISGLVGRNIELEDRREGEGVVVVNQAFVDRYLADKDPIGTVIELSIGLGYDSDPPRTIIGVVDNNLSTIPQEQVRPEMFVPQAQMAASWMSVVMRSSGGFSWPAVTEAFRQVDPNIPLQHKDTVETGIAEDLGPARFYVVLLGTFAAIAVFLAAIGLYGVISYLVSRRTREIAIRLAVGADTRAVIGHFLGEGLKLVAVGVLIGLGIASFGSRWLESMLYEVKAFDVSTYALVCVGMIVVATLAILAPARRAGRVAPARALKEE